VTDLIIIGASGLAREVLAVVRETGSHRPVGVLDDDPRSVGDSFDGVAVLGTIADLGVYLDTELVLCVGSGRARERIMQRIARSGYRTNPFATIVDPGVRNPSRSPIGAGSILLGNTSITASASIGEHVVVMPGVTITHDDVVESFTTLASGVSLGGGVRVGRGAYLGMNAAVLPGVTIGRGAVVGMGAAVLGDVPEDETWAGVPARSLADRTTTTTYSEAAR
jgi:sugar O-acyltransferase (sialic acid O-acetyltransferase NeuD family)